MPPRLPTPSAGSSLLRSLARPFSSTPAVALPPREPSHANRLVNLGGSAPSHHGNSNSNHHHGGRGSTHVRRDYAEKYTQKRGEAASRLLERFQSRTDQMVREKSMQSEFLRDQKISGDFLRQMPRRWEAGDVYSPHDLSPVEMAKWRKRSVRNNDVVDALGISPIDMYKNFSLIEYFTSPSGMIRHSKETRLRPVNQRKIAKMVRRVQGMGIYPSIHHHPEMLRQHFFDRR